LKFLVNKIGAIVKLVVNMFYDKKLVGDMKVLKKDILPVYNWSTTVQSVDYLYIQKSLENFSIEEGDIVLDLGSGKGRILLYLNYIYKRKNIQLIGAEISDEAFLISKELLEGSNVFLFHVNAIEHNFIIENKINKLILFNPFNPEVFKEFIDYIAENIKYKFEFLYINISSEQLKVIKQLQIKYIKYELDYPFYGINDKVNIVGYLN